MGRMLERSWVIGAWGRASVHRRADQSLDAGTVQRVPRWAADLFSPLARPQLATHLIVGELYEIEGCRIGWRTSGSVLVVLDPHKRLVVGEPGDGCEGEGIEDVRVILQHLRSYQFGSVGYAHAFVVFKLRADHDGELSTGLKDADMAASSVRRGMDVVADKHCLSPL